MSEATTWEGRLARVAPGLSPALRGRLAARGHVMGWPDGARLFAPGDASQAFLIPLAGAVRVEHAGPSGRSVVLYRVGPGESCVMTTSCLLAGVPYAAWGYAEGALEALAIPAPAFGTLLDEDAEFRALAFRIFSRRIVELVEVIDELLLHRVDLRLAGWLARRALAEGEAEPVLRATHQALAGELGTAREVVSRILKEFERRGWVRLGRGTIRVLDAAALARFAASEAR